QRTLAILQSDGRTGRPYVPPPGWQPADFAAHPSGDTPLILTTAAEVRIVRLDPNGSIRSEQLFLDPAAATDPFFNYAGGLKNDDALQPALMHDAARLAPLGESLAVVLRTGRNAIVAIVSTLTRAALISVPGGRWESPAVRSLGKASRAAASTCSVSSRIT